MNIQTIVGGSLYTNCYMAWEEGSDTCVLVDPGFDPEQILEQVRCAGKKVEAILLTHTHHDHVFGVKGIVEITGCKVFVHKAELTIGHKTKPNDICATDFYDDGDELTLAGIQFKVIHTPGHTAGCVCLLAEDVMFSGDTLFAGTCGRTDIPPYGNPPQMRDSLARLKALEGDYGVFPGHGHSSTLEEERRTNPFMQGL
jgi:glyoxylase-like metal-dependent hydrolase (beta-lactamase superfamily II)